MDDLISRQALCEYALNQKDKSVTPNDIMRFPSAQPEPCEDAVSRRAVINIINKPVIIKAKEQIEALPSVQPKSQPTCNNLATDTISRQDAIDALDNIVVNEPNAENALYVFKGIAFATDAVQNLPSAHPTLYGYNIEHLELIASVLQKEDLPPERIVEVLTDIGRIVAIVADEFEESLRKAVEQCTI